MVYSFPPSSRAQARQIKAVCEAQTIVVKIGTASFSQPDGAPRMDILNPLADQLIALRKEGHRVLLVSSGAIGLGRRKIGWASPLSEEQKGVAAMVGQSALIQVYSELFERRGFLPAAQGLLQNANLCNGDDVHSPRSVMLGRLTAAFAVDRLIPVLNENDFVSGAEITPFDPSDPETYSDNDGLSSLTARILGADQMITISTHSLHTANPCLPRSRPVRYINFASAVLNPETLGISTQGVSCGGTGGMENKLAMQRAYVQASGLCGKRTAHIVPFAEVPQGGIIRAVSGEIVGTKLICNASEKSRAWRRDRLPDPACCRYEF